MVDCSSLHGAVNCRESPGPSRRAAANMEFTGSRVLLPPCHTVQLPLEPLLLSL